MQVLVRLGGWLKATGFQRFKVRAAGSGASYF